MKHFLRIILSVVFVVSCKKIEPQHLSRQITKSPTTKSFITKAALDNYNVSQMEASILANLLTEGQKDIKIKAYTDKKDTLFYVVNYGSGWKIISGDKRTQAILAEDNTCHLDLQTVDSPGVKIWFDDLADYLKAMKNKQIDKFETENPEFWRKVTSNLIKKPILPKSIDPTDTSEIGNGYRWVRFYRGTTTSESYINTIPHMLVTKWGQSSPWNNGYPYNPYNPAQVAPTGCTAVAMAQVIYHSHFRLGKPLWLRHGSTVSGYIYDSDNFSYFYTPGPIVDNSSRWDDMPLFSSDANTDYVSSLMADVGSVVRMKYGLSGSGAWPSVSAFNQFDLECSHTESLNVSTVNTSLLSGSPVVIVAFATRTGFWGMYSYSDGHTWVIDGKTTIKRDISSEYEWILISHLPYFPTFNEPDCQYYTQAEAMAYDPELYSGKIEVINTSSYSDYWFMNWGYNGSYDSGLYYAYGDWTIGTTTFKYQKEIWHNFQ